MMWISIATLLVTALVGCSSIIIAIRTLKQNAQMIEDSTRPIIMIYKEVIHINNPNEYLVIKNFGKSSALITELLFDKKKFNKISSGIKDKSLSLKNVTLAPNQKYYFPIKTRNDSSIKNINFNIKYNSSIKTYTDTFKINFQQDYSIIYDKHHITPKNIENELETIDNTLQEFIKKIL